MLSSGALSKRDMKAAKPRLQAARKPRPAESRGGLNTNVGTELQNRVTALDASSEGIALTGPDGCYTYINPAHLSLFGYREAAEVLGKSWHIFYTQEEIAFIEKSVYPVLLEKKVWRGRLRGHRKDRTHFVQELSLNLLPDGGLACICSDATERIEAIEQRERLFSVSKSLLVICDFEGNIKQFNPAWTDLLGYTSKELLSRPILSHVFPEDRAATAAVMEDLGRGIPIVNFTNRFLASDGRILTLDWSSTSSLEQGLIFASAHNITKRRVVEQSLRESEDNFRTFFETLDDMVFVGDQNGQILFSNRAASRKLGYSPEELRTMLLIDLHPAELRQKAAEIVGAMLCGERETCPLPLEKKSGGRLLVETRVWPGKWDGRDCLFGLCKDITEEQEAQQRFELLFRNSPALMALTTLPERRFVDVNTAFLSTLGYSKEQVVGKTAIEVRLFPDEAAMDLTSVKLESDGRLHNMEILARRADGTLIEGLFSAEVVVMKGQRHLLTVMNDVTTLNRTARMLKESEGRFRRAADSAPVLLWEADVDGLCSNFNKPWLEFTGRTLEQELGNGWVEGVHPEDLETCLRTYRLALQAHREFKMEYRLRRADGEYRWLQDHGVPRFTPDGVFVGFIGSCLDITEIKESKRLQEELLDRILKIAGRVPGVIYQYRLRPDGSSCFPFASDAIKEIYRVTPQEVREDAAKVFANLHPDDRDGIVESILKSAQDLTPWQYEYRVKFADGTVRALYGNAVPQREADGSVLWHGFITDITERKQKAEELKLLAERLSLATKAGHVGIWDWDVVNDRLVWDDHMYRQYGITREQFAGAYEAWAAGLHPDDRERGDAEIQMALRGEKDFNTEFRVVWPDGSIHHIRAMALVQRNADGNPLHMIGTNWDITNQKRAEAIVLQNVVRAEELARLKTRFVSMASHELRTPIANILLACELLKNFGNAMPAERSQSLLSGLMTGVTSMVRTLDDLLLAGMIEEGKLPYTPARFALLDFLKRCCLEVQPDLESPSRIEVAFRDAGLSVVADERLLHHILKNLLENALKYSPADTKIGLEVKVGTDSLTLTVVDRGIGVPEKDREFLFDAFSRASNVRDEPGSGLGLFIAQKCAQAHAGHLHYTPLPVGSAFSFTAPFAAPAGTKRLSPDRPPAVENSTGADNGSL
ncbi:MAG: PAS domain S-box protein [Verrucomicrobiaceae bacterium]|nr:MAG: PAS domain S-box protein [Verrucomicrobiaceae bacterium]